MTRLLTDAEKKKAVVLLREAVETQPPWCGFRCTLLMTEYEAAVVVDRMEEFFASCLKGYKRWPG